jgi:hypothetical protein
VSKEVSTEQVVAYLNEVRKKLDIVQENPDMFWEVVITIVKDGDALPDVVMLVTKDEYKKAVGQLTLSMVRALSAFIKKARK